MHLVVISGKRKRDPGTLQTRDQNFPNRAHIFKNKLGNRLEVILETSRDSWLKFIHLVRKTKHKNKIKTYE